MRNRQYKLNRKGRFVKIYKQPSQTVPDDSYTVKDILSKFTRGIDPMLTRLGDYDGDQNSDLSEQSFEVNPIRLIEDLTDIQDLERFLEKTEQQKIQLLKEIEKRKKEAENSAT